MGQLRLATEVSYDCSRQFQHRQRDDLGRVDQVVDTAVFVRLVREIQDARAVGDAVRHAGDPRDVLLIVGPGAGDQAAASAEHAVQRPIERRRRPANRPASARGARPSDRSARSGNRASSARWPSSSSTISAFVASKPSSSRKRRSNTARHVSATHGVWMPPHRLAAVDAVDVQRRVPRTRGNHRDRGRPRGEPRLQLPLHPVEHEAHVLDRARPEERHAAVRDAAARHHFEPVDAAMADADPIDVERLRDDDVVGPLGAEPAVLGEPGDAGEAAALFVHRAADLDRAVAARRRRGGCLRPRTAPRRCRPSCRTIRGRRSARPRRRRRTDRASSRRRPARRRSGRSGARPGAARVRAWCRRR